MSNNADLAWSNKMTIDFQTTIWLTDFVWQKDMQKTTTLDAKVRYQYATFIILETYSDRRMHSLLDLHMPERTHSSC